MLSVVTPSLFVLDDVASVRFVAGELHGFVELSLEQCGSGLWFLTLLYNIVS